MKKAVTAVKGKEAQTPFEYYQYFKEFDLPVFIKVEREQFGDELDQFFKEHRFTKLNAKEIDVIDGELEHNYKVRILSLRLATATLATQIRATGESDRFGLERISPQNGYRVYRYKAHAMMTYSFGSQEWELGCFTNFGKATLMESRVVIMRFVSWALAASGIIGFWGVPVEDGIVVLRQNEANGEAVFVDILNKRIFTLDGVKKMKPLFSIMRLDSTLRERQVRMTMEELVSFLSMNCTYFDYTTMNVSVRQVIHTLSKCVQGYLLPRESFRPRTDLSL